MHVTTSCICNNDWNELVYHGISTSTTEIEMHERRKIVAVIDLLSMPCRSLQACFLICRHCCLHQRLCQLAILEHRSFQSSYLYQPSTGILDSRVGHRSKVSKQIELPFSSDKSSILFQEGITVACFQWAHRNCQSWSPIAAWPV